MLSGERSVRGDGGGEVGVDDAMEVETGAEDSVSHKVADVRMRKRKPREAAGPKPLPRVAVLGAQSGLTREEAKEAAYARAVEANLCKVRYKQCRSSVYPPRYAMASTFSPFASFIWVALTCALFSSHEAHLTTPLWMRLLPRLLWSSNLYMGTAAKANTSAPKTIIYIS